MPATAINHWLIFFPQWVLFSCRAVITLSYFLKTLALGCSSLCPYTSLSLSSLSWGPDILEMPTISLLRSGLTIGVRQSQIPSDSPLGCLLANLGPLRLMPELKPWKLIFLCNKAWPQYPLDNASKWPLNDTFNPNILRDLYNLCEHAGKWKELFYIQSFPYVCTKPSLCTFCSPVQILLAAKPVSKSTNSSPKPPPSPCKQTSCAAYHAYLFLSSWGTFPSWC
jgi:hypothetical protein